VSGVDPSAIRAGLEAVTRDINTFVDRVNALLGFLPAPVAALAVDRIGGGIGEPFVLTREEIDRLLAFAGSPAALRSAGDTWVRDVAALVSGVAATTNVGVMVGDDAWSGPAASAYRAVIPLQAAALTAVTTAATETNTTLHDFAAALEAFWASIAFAVAALAVAIAALAVAVLLAETVLGAIAAGIVAVGAFVTAVDKAVTALTTLNTKQAADVAVLRNRLATNTAFPDGRWPASTNDLRDASILDGDPTDWRLTS
jgi:hypothetical protein